MKDDCMTEKKVLGFVFDQSLSKVALRTVVDEGELQGLLNGINASNSEKSGTYQKTMLDKLHDEFGAPFDYDSLHDVGTINTPHDCIKVFYLKVDDIESLTAKSHEMEVYPSSTMHKNHGVAPLLSTVMGYILIADNQKS